MDPKFTKHKVAYAGLDYTTFSILNTSDKLDLRVIADISNQFNTTFNPFNFLFYLIYYFKKNSLTPYPVYKILAIVIQFIDPFLTKSYKKFSPLLKTCLKKSIIITDFSKEQITRSFIKKEGVELLIINTWSILPETIFLAPSRGSLNIHPSRLPQYRGSLPTLWSLKNNDPESAVTVFVLDKDMDKGSLVAQHTFDISPTDNSLTLEKKIHGILKKDLITDVLNYLNGQSGNLIISKKDIAESKTAKYEDYREIDLKNESARDIVNKIILYPYIDSDTYCFITINKRKIFIKNAKILNINNVNTDTSIKLSGINLVCKPKKGIFSARLFADVGFKDSLWFLFYFKPMYNLDK